jgi:DNA replication protein DnaC
MNTAQTIDRLIKMRLGSMADLHRRYLETHGNEQMTHDEYLALLVDHEWEQRYQRKTNRITTQASFRQHAKIEEVDFNAARNLDKQMFQRLATLEFIDRGENLIVTGASGVGKSFVAQALGQKACVLQRTVRYFNTAKLFAQLQLAKLDGSLLRELHKLSKIDLLILDDFGLQTLDVFGRETLLEIIDSRFGRSSTVIASQLPVAAWYELIGESTIADALLDRLVHSSHRIDLKGESKRKGMIETIQ